MGLPGSQTHKEIDSEQSPKHFDRELYDVMGRVANPSLMRSQNTSLEEFTSWLSFEGSVEVGQE